MPRYILRLHAAVLALFLCTALLPIRTEAVSTSASAAVLMDADSGRILYAHNEHAPMLIASTTKIMTALVAIENGCLTDVATVKKEATLAEGTSMYLREGEQLTLETLLYGLLLSSGNDAALVIADTVGGSVTGFVKMMNEKAARLGMSNTSFANPNGLDAEGHHSTALDMALLAQAAMENATLVRIASTASVSVGGRTMSNHNRLLKTVDGCIGLKTGYTKAAGRTLVSCAERNGQRLIAVTLQDGNDWVDHAALFDYGFSEFPKETRLFRGEMLTELPVIDGTANSVRIAAAGTLSWPVGKEELLTVEYDLPAVLSAPVRAGETAGRAVLLMNGKEVMSVPLYCAEAVAAAAAPEKPDLLQRLRARLGI